MNLFQLHMILLELFILKYKDKYSKEIINDFRKMVSNYVVKSTGFVEYKLFVESAVLGLGGKLKKLCVLYLHYLDKFFAYPLKERKVFGYEEN